MSEKITQQKSFLLHKRSYRESSFFLELFSRDYGRISLLAKGAKRSRCRFRGNLVPFLPIYVSWVSNREKFTLTEVEGCEFGPLAHRARATLILCGFYLNELLMRFLKPNQILPDLFDKYAQTLHLLSQNPEKKEQEIALRKFEKQFIKYLGYELPLNKEIQTHQPILPDQCYYYEIGMGPRIATLTEKQLGLNVFPGKGLIALDQEDFSDPDNLIFAKRFIQYILKTQFGAQDFKTRELFR